MRSVLDFVRHTNVGLFATIFALLAAVLLAASFAFTESGLVSVDSTELNLSSICNNDTFIEFGSCQEAGPANVLVMTKASVFAHPSIPAGKQMLERMAEQSNFTVTFSEDSTIFQRPDDVERFDAVIFLNTDSVVFEGVKQKQAFRDFIEQGRGYVGIHGAAATHWKEDKWDWYRELVGQRQTDHPRGVQEAVVVRLDENHPSTSHLPDRWTVTDEWYNYEGELINATPVLSVDRSTYSGGRGSEPHPVAWYKTLGESRSWYTNLGHQPALYSDINYQKHVLGGIEWVLDDL